MFSIGESLRQAWLKFREHIKISILATLLVLVVGSFVGGGNAYTRGILSLVLIVLSIILRCGYNKIFLRIYDGGSPNFKDIFQEYRLFWKFLGVSILYPLAVLGGLILFIVPGLIWVIRFSFSPLILIDLKIGPVAAMKESYAITKGNFFKVLGFWLVMALINILGVLIFGVGLLVSVPVSTLASIYVYRELTKAKAGIIA